MLTQDFYAQEAAHVAKDLIGRHLIVQQGNRHLRCRIVETEAYVGAHDLACHAAKGRTKRTEILYGPAGYIYVYLIYGMHFMLNIVTGALDSPQAVLIRAVEPLSELKGRTDGPGRLSKTLGIDKSHNTLSALGPPIWLETGKAANNIGTTPRIGIDYAKEWKNAPLRFIDKDSSFLSRQANTKSS